MWRLLQSPSTYVYVAGLAAVGEMLDKVLAQFAGTPDKWARRKAELVAGGRWTEVLY